ncbi:hypothetical protein L7F22_056919 [Adiantum nelumboides]|nr:hypothetical protein [Adiantum nelumboides]
MPPLHYNGVSSARSGDANADPLPLPGLQLSSLSLPSSTLVLDVDSILHAAKPVSCSYGAGAPQACLSDGQPRGANVTFKVVIAAVVAVLRFQNVVHSHEISLSVDILPHADTRNVIAFHPDIIKSVTEIVQTRNFEIVKKLDGLQGLASQLHTDLTQGLSTGFDDSDPEALLHRKHVFGENAYPRKKGKTLWGFLWEACHDTMLNILMLCAALSLGLASSRMGLKKDGMTGQSGQFQRLSEERDNIQVQVIRGSHRIIVPLVDIVVGDLVQLNIGDQVPADGLLVKGQSLSIDESSFTGESDYYIPDPDEQAFLRSGSKIQDGYGTMLVTAVGINTEWGCMMALLSTSNDTEETPLQTRLSEAATLIGKVGLSVALLVLVILNVFYFTGHSSSSGDPKFVAGETSATEILDALVHIFSIAVTIIVVAVPEGLPLAVTLTLAYSMRKMMKDNALVRRLAACETMGSATTICSDKTGTLTMNQMTVVKSWIAGKTLTSETEEFESSQMLPSNLQSLLFQGIAQNSTGSVESSSKQFGSNNEKPMQVEVVGSPTEKALLCWGLKAGMKFQAARSESCIVHVETFNSTKKRAGVAVETSDKQLVIHWKGAAEIILSMCNKWLDMEVETDAGESTLSERLMSAEKRQELQSIIESMASGSLRCVALAYTTLPQESVMVGKAGRNWILPDADLTFLAVVGMKDPCRPTVKAAVSAVKAAGVTVRMVTGDNLATAKAIALECGILEMGADHIAVEGTILRSWTENERKKNLPRVAVIARALPSDKLLLVETLQSMGDVVAVTGDGTNDAPALHKADIGLSMGIQGTEVAKESSDIIILDDNFASVVKVVRWGRSVNFNIQKFLQFQLTVNVTALTVNFVAAVSSGDVPLTVVQLLWVNLIMDTLGALALATEPPTDELMQKPPVGRKEPLITYTMWRNLAVQAIYQVVVLLTLQFKGVDLLCLSGEEDADTINRTVIFNSFVLCQLFNEMNARQPYRRNIFRGLGKNRLFVGIVAATVILQVVMVEFLEKFASTVRLDWQQWLVCIGLASLSWPIALLAKFIPVPQNRPSSKKKGHVLHEESHSNEREGSEPQDESMEDVAPRRRRAQRSPTSPKRKWSPHSPHHRESKREEKSSRKKERKRLPSSPSSSPSSSSDKSSGILVKKSKGEDTEDHMLRGNGQPYTHDDLTARFELCNWISESIYAPSKEATFRCRETYHEQEQPTVAFLSIEVEYRGAAILACEVAWLKMLLETWRYRYKIRLSYIVITSTASN